MIGLVVEGYGTRNDSDMKETSSRIGSNALDTYSSVSIVEEWVEGKLIACESVLVARYYSVFVYYFIILLSQLRNAFGPNLYFIFNKFF